MSLTSPIPHNCQDPVPLTSSRGQGITAQADREMLAGERKKHGTRELLNMAGTEKTVDTVRNYPASLPISNLRKNMGRLSKTNTKSNVKILHNYFMHLSEPQSCCTDKLLKKKWNNQGIKTLRMNNEYGSYTVYSSKTEIGHSANICISLETGCQYI